MGHGSWGESVGGIREGGLVAPESRMAESVVLFVGGAVEDVLFFFAEAVEPVAGNLVENGVDFAGGVDVDV